MRAPTTKRRDGLWLAAALTGVVALVVTAAVTGGTQAMWAQSVDVDLPSIDVRMVSDTPPPTPVQCTGDPTFFPEELRLGSEPVDTVGGKDVWAFDWDTFESTWGGWARYREVTSANFNPFDWDGDGFADGWDTDPCTFTTPQPLPCRAGLNTAAEALYLTERGGDPAMYDERFVDWDEDGWSDAYELGLLEDFGAGLVYYLNVDADGRVTQPPTYHQAFVARYGPDTPLNVPARSNPCSEPSQPTPNLCVGTPYATWALNIPDRAALDPAYIAEWFVNPNQMFVGNGPWQAEVKEGAPGAVRADFGCKGAVDLQDLSIPPSCTEDRIVNATGSATSGTFGDYTTVVDKSSKSVTVSWNLEISSQWSSGDTQAELVIAVPARWVSTTVGNNAIGGGLFQASYSRQAMTVNGVPVTPVLSAGVAEYRFRITPDKDARDYPQFIEKINITFTLTGSSTGSLGLANILATMFVDSTTGDWQAQGASTTVMANTNNSIKTCADVPAGFLLAYTAGGSFVDVGGTIVWRPTPPAWFG